MRFTSITLNPAIDRIEYLDTLTENGLNRPTRTQIKAGGKGINVARTIGMLKDREGDRETVVTAITTAGGYAGEELKALLENEEFYLKVIPTRFETRQALKLVTKSGTTEINEIGKIEKEALYTLVEILADQIADGEKTVVILSGSFPKVENSDADPFYVEIGKSFPQDVEKNVENSLITLLESCGIPVIVDTSGESLVESLKASPSLIKPNQTELEALYGAPLDDEKKLVDFCRELYVDNGCEILCTRGENGAIFVGKEGIFKKDSHRVFPCDPTGAGDTYLAAFLYARYQKRLSIDQCLSYADGITREYLENSLT